MQILVLIGTVGTYAHMGEISQSINQFISRHSIEARDTVRLCGIKENTTL